MSTNARIDEALIGAVGIAFDGCHKIYIILDEAMYSEFAGIGYGDDESFLMRIQHEADGRERAASKLADWWDDSCGLRFITAVHSNPKDPNAGYEDIVAQGDEWADEHSDRLEYLRAQVRAERISMSELAELQELAGFIDPGDVELLQWAGVPEFPEGGLA